MKPLIQILSHEEFISYILKAKTFSYEVSKKGLIISSACLNVRLLVDVTNLNMIKNKLQVFNKDFITVQDDFNFNQCNKYINNAKEDINQFSLNNLEQLMLF